MDIDCNCPHLLFGEGALFNSIFFNVDNSIKREMRKNCFSKNKNSTFNGQTDGRTGGVAISPVPGLRRRGR